MFCSVLSLYLFFYDDGAAPRRVMGGRAADTEGRSGGGRRAAETEGIWGARRATGVLMMMMMVSDLLGAFLFFFEGAAPWRVTGRRATGDEGRLGGGMRSAVRE